MTILDILNWFRTAPLGEARETHDLVGVIVGSRTKGNGRRTPQARAARRPLVPAPSPPSEPAVVVAASLEEVKQRNRERVRQYRERKAQQDAPGDREEPKRRRRRTKAEIAAATEPQVFTPPPGTSVPRIFSADPPPEEYGDPNEPVE